MKTRVGNSCIVGVLAGIAVVAIGVALNHVRNARARKPALVKVQFAYPVTSLNPLEYKDWQSVFVGNHIYPRFTPQDRGPSLNYITKEVLFSCEVPKSNRLDENCKTVRLWFSPISFTDCMGRNWWPNDIRSEFEKDLKDYPWILPNWKRCDGNSSQICVVGDYRSDIRRWMNSAEFRFGWSRTKETDTRFGAGPYCLSELRKSQRGITGGILSPFHKDDTFPAIQFFVSEDPKSDFNLALYGSKKLITGSRKNVHAHTPVGFYVVTNPSLADRSLPWNQEDSKKIIDDVFLREEVFFSAASNITKIFPAGSALTKSRPLTRAAKQLEFVLPDYLPACEELAEKLTAQWRTRGNAGAVCKDIVSFVYDHVWGPKKDWDGFIVGVTQWGRRTAQQDFFSPDSPISWTYKYPKPEKLFYLAGVGQSLVTLDGERFCDLKPNLFGLGDVFISDLIPCKRSWFAGILGGVTR